MPGPRPAAGEYRLDSDRVGLVHYPCLHGGKGGIDVKFLFRDEGFAEPSLLLIYNIPPGSSEGVHVHQEGDTELGLVDEFYYILEGQGEMQIDGKTVAVNAGDHVFTPAGVPHGIENTAGVLLRVHLTAVIRSPFDSAKIAASAIEPGR
jgi:Cupin domain